MKKILALLLAMCMVFALAACGESKAPEQPAETPAAETPAEAPADETAEEPAEATDMRVAMITDYGDITDQSFNQTTYEACKAYCDENGVDFTYFKPAGDNTSDRVAMIEKAVDEDYNVIVMPGFAFAEAIAKVQDEYPEVKFVALDVSEFDIMSAFENEKDAHLSENVYSAVYQEELCGYMAGYAAVKMGYKHLGFLGGMAVPAVVRYGFGFIQGVDAAAKELGIENEVAVEYVYGNTFSGDADITAYMDTWYGELGVEVVFAAGGGIFTSAAEAAAKVDGKLIGVDVDQAGIINTAYGDGMTVTSAMKGLAATVKHMLSEIAAGNFANYGGKVENLGLVSGDDVTMNYVQLPLESTVWNDGFTQDNYKELVKAMFDGTITVESISDASAMPEHAVTVNEYGNIK